MSQALIDELKRENLCTYFILPFIKLNKSKFITAGFSNTYLHADRKKIAIRISEPILLPRELYSHPEYVAVYKDLDGTYLIMFRILKRWDRDIELFCQGKYSQLSTPAKEAIKRHSGLAYQRKEDGKIVTDGRLLALEKHNALRGMWLGTLFEKSGKGIDDGELFLPDEYLSSPGEESFINPVSLAKIREAQL